MHGSQMLEKALRMHGIEDSARLESHIRGWDFRQPVTEETLDVGTTFAVWVRDGGVLGKYGAPEDEDPQRLGIIVEGRHREVFRVQQPVSVVRCVAATFPIGVIHQVGGLGGGTQYLLPPNWLDAVERIA